MDTGAIDPNDFRDAQHESWDSAAQGWNDWCEFSERAESHISERLVEMAGVREGSQVLDVAAGYGEPSLTAARAIGPPGRVVATDISDRMLAFGRRRAEAAGLQNVEFMQSDASDLDFVASSFDAAVSRWGIIFEPDAAAAAGRIRRFLKPGARMAISSWGAPEEVPFLSVPMKAVTATLDLPWNPAGTPGPLSRPTPTALGDLLDEAGFSEIEVGQDTVTFEFESPEHLTAYIRAIAAPVRTMIEQHAGDGQEEAWQSITETTAAVTGGSGPFRFSNVVPLAAGVA